MIEGIDINEIPVFVINGFLEAGKSSFIEYTLNEPYFHIDGRTLLILCEEGEVSFNPKTLKKQDVLLINVSDKEKLTVDYLNKLTIENDIERVIIEHNSMWGAPEEIKYPDKWALYQQITMFDGSTLKMYLSNMKALMGPMLKNSELVIINRCDELNDSDLVDFKRKLRPMMAAGTMLIMENKYGEIPVETLPEELPFDVSGDDIVINDADYGVWYIDARDNPDRYIGKTIEFTGEILKSPKFDKDYFVPGRNVMTCCEADMTFLGYLAHYEGIDSYNDGAFVKLKAKFSIAKRKEYGGEGPLLIVESLAHTAPIYEPCGF